MKKVILPLLVSISLQMPIFKAYAETPTPESIQKMNLSPEEELKKANELSRILCHQNLNSSQAIRAQVERKEQEMSLLLEEIHTLRMGKIIATYAGPAVVISSSAYAIFRFYRLGQEVKKTKDLIVKNGQNLQANEVSNSVNSQAIANKLHENEKELSLLLHRRVIPLAIGNVAVLAISLESLNWIESTILKRLEDLKELSEFFGEDAVLCALAQSR